MTQPGGPPIQPPSPPLTGGEAYDVAAIEKELIQALQAYRQDLGVTPTLNGNQNVANLLKRTFTPPKWAIEGLLPEGLSVFAGKPKIGKSWMALDWCLAVAAGRDAINNFGAQPGNCLYIAYEDSERRLQDRVRKLGGHLLPDQTLERFDYRVEFPDLDNGGIGALDQWLTEHPNARLIIIDTFARFRGKVAGRDKYTEDYQAAALIHSLAKKHGVAIVVVHHLRKESADDWLDRVSGTNGLTGAADTIAVLLRDRGKSDGMLKVVGRDIEELDRAVSYEDGHWKDHGEASLFVATQERREILEVMATAFEGSAKPSDIAVALDKKSGTVAKLLAKLTETGHVRKAKYGVYVLSNPLVEPFQVVEPPPTTSTTSTTSTRDSKETRRSDQETTESDILPFADSDDYEPDPDDLPDPY